MRAPWPKAEALLAFVRTRWLQRRLRTRADVARWQGRQVKRLLARLGDMPFYAGRDRSALAALPVIDKAVLMGDFAAFNRAGVSAEAGWAALGAGGRLGRLHVGASTGTSGNRGLYVIDEAERWRWLGTILAKTMKPLRRARIALILPMDSSLYEAARRSLLTLRFFDLTRGVAACVRDTIEFDPDTVIAPPKVLRQLAESGAALPRLRHVFSAAEVLDPLDRVAIETRFGVKLREIYMATEGLLGVACEQGTLHLCEDCVAFEFERPVEGSELVAPVITDFSRHTQAMVRYRMNDLLVLDEAPCPCGSPLQAVKRIEGRLDDVLRFAGPHGDEAITPDVLRNAVVMADRRIDDFRLVQTGPDRLVLMLAAGLPDEAARAAERRVGALLASLGLDVAVALERPATLPVPTRKLRRVERQWRG